MIDQAKRDALVSQTAKWFDHHPREPKDLFSATTPTYGGGTALFARLAPETLEQLVTEGFANPDDAQNQAPTLGEMLAFLKQNPGFTGNGYTVTAERDDCRLTITGIEFYGTYNPEQLDAFREFAQDADEKTIRDNYLYCWWD